MLIWQQHDAKVWRFGEVARGLVRRPYYAEVLYTEGYTSDDAGWHWYTYAPGRHYHSARGLECDLDAAVAAAEKVLAQEGLLQ